MSRASALIEEGTMLPALSLPPISRTTIALFAGASGDHNPIHLDVDLARSVGMPDVFAQGMLSMAYLGRMLTTWIPQQRLRSWEVRFVNITPVNASVNCTGRVTSIHDIKGERIADVDLTVALADGTVTLSGRAAVAIY